MGRLDVPDAAAHGGGEGVGGKEKEAGAATRALQNGPVSGCVRSAAPPLSVLKGFIEGFDRAGDDEPP